MWKWIGFNYRYFVDLLMRGANLFCQFYFKQFVLIFKFDFDAIPTIFTMNCCYFSKTTTFVVFNKNLTYFAFSERKNFDINHFSNYLNLTTLFILTTKLTII